MKKLILLLLLPLTTLMAVDYTMTKEGLFANTAAQSPTPGDTPAPGTGSGKTNPYLEPVNLPKCDANNPEVQFIRTNAEWSNINSSSKRIFCVSPGDYRSLGNIKLTASGTAAKRRYIILNNGNDLHPGKLDISQIAMYSLRFSNADYWVIDRQAFINSNVSTIINFASGSSYNIINRMYTNDIVSSVQIHHMSNNNTIQNSRFENMKGPSDGVAIALINWGSDYYEVKNTKIINNEFVDQNDGFQSNRSPKYSSSEGKYQNANVEGTIIDGNDFYVTTGDNLENGVDLKVGSDNPANPIIVTNNRMWGYVGPKGEGDTAMVVHYSTKNVKINNNVFFDCKSGFVTGSNGPVSGFSYGIVTGEMTDNLFYNCGATHFPVLTIAGSRDFDAYKNTIIEGKWHYGKFAYNAQATFFRNNTLVDSTTDVELISNASDFTNALTSNDWEGVRATYTQDYIFTTDKFTNKPRVITLPNVLK